jgi:UTP--glucose-1-phosphate uridylyltransferase
VWINQPQLKGFGDAVLRSKSFVSNEVFIVSAGDTYIISKNENHFKRLLKMHSDLDTDVSLLAMEVSNPKEYGIIEAVAKSSYLKVSSAIEKPAKPRSRLAIMPFYVFKPVIFNTLESLTPGVGGEIQLTDAINELINSGYRVYATKLFNDEYRLDIGTPETYWEAIKLSHDILTTGRLG